ncbi:restriction endonuclease subunit S [Legionella pneumophila]
MSLLSIKDKIRLPSDWAIVPIGKILLSSQYGTSNGNSDDGVPIIGMKNLQDGKVNFIDLPRVSLDKEEKEKLLINDEDILLNRTNSYDLVGKIGYIEKACEAVFASYLVRLQVDKTKSSPKFIAMWLSSFWAEQMIKKIATRAVSQANVNPTEFKKYCLIPIIPLPEQNAIIDLLSTWDETIEKIKKLIIAKRKLKLSELHTLIFRNKANSAIGTFANLVVRKANKPNSAYKALGIRSHFKGTFQRLIEEPDTVSMESLYKVKENDLIVNITFAWEGAIALVKKEDEACYVSHRFPTYEIKNAIAEPCFIRQLIMSNRMKYILSNISPGGAGRNRVLNKNDFLRVPIWLPDLKTQQDIGEYLGSIDKEINLLEQILEKYKKQKRGLMQKMLTGQWRIKPEIVNKYAEM